MVITREEDEERRARLNHREDLLVLFHAQLSLYLDTHPFATLQDFCAYVLRDPQG